MAGTIDTVRARDALKARHTAYWQRVRKGCYVGLRKTTAGNPGSWLARHRDDDSGKQVVHSLGHLDDVAPADRFDRAKALAEKWFAHRSAGGSVALLTVADACDDYVKHIRAGGRSRTADDTTARFKRWVYPDTKFAQTALMKLTTKTVEEWRRKLAQTPVRRGLNSTAAKRPRSSSALNRDMTSLRAALNLALENGHVASDAAWRSKLRPVKDANGRRDIYLDIDQRRALIAHAAPDLANFLRGLALLPIRPGALAAMVVSDFDPRLCTLRIGKDKTGRERRISLPDNTAQLFVKAIDGRQPGDPLLCRADGAAWTKDAWKKPLKQAAAIAELPIGTVAYALRHSAITDLIALHKLDTMTVAQLAGTSLLMIEKNYGHLLREHAKSALAGLAL
jgi:integrase